jgi:isoprenylcysteine carboxyl methyltransferase (ICMT) family protein YpbQ
LLICLFFNGIVSSVSTRLRCVIKCYVVFYYGWMLSGDSLCNKNSIEPISIENAFICYSFFYVVCCSCCYCCLFWSATIPVCQNHHLNPSIIFRWFRCYHNHWLNDLPVFSLSSQR